MRVIGSLQELEVCEFAKFGGYRPCHAIIYDIPVTHPP